MNRGAPHLRASLGACGSGKSRKLAMMVDEDLAAGLGPFVVMDLSDNDWPGICKRHRHAKVSSAAAAAAALENGERFIIVKPPEQDEDSAAELGAELCELAVKVTHVTLVLPEAHTVAPQEGNYLPPAVAEVAHRWRHKHLRLWLDTQYTQVISKRLLRACQTWYWFASSGGDTVDRARELYKPLADDIAVVSQLASRKSKGRGIITEPGWHVEIPVLTPELRVIVSPDGKRYTPEQAAKLL